MISVSTNDDALAVELIANATQIGMKLSFYRWQNQRLPVFGAKHKVDIVFD